MPEGEVIPLSAVTQTKTKIGNIVLDKWRKASSAENIMKHGYNNAVVETDAKALNEVQKSIRTKFFTFLGNINDTTTVTGTTLQAVLAGSWGKLQVKFDNDDIQPVHFVNPEDIADYLKMTNEMFIVRFAAPEAIGFHLSCFHIAAADLNVWSTSRDWLT